MFDQLKQESAGLRMLLTIESPRAVEPSCDNSGVSKSGVAALPRWLKNFCQSGFGFIGAIVHFRPHVPMAHDRAARIVRHGINFVHLPTRKG